MIHRSPVAAAALFLLAACGPEQQSGPAAPEPAAVPDLAAQARDLARNSIIIDTHIDVPYRIYNNWEDVSGATEGGDYD